MLTTRALLIATIAIASGYTQASTQELDSHPIKSNSVPSYSIVETSNNTNSPVLPAPITSDAISGQINLDQLHEDSGVFVEYTFPGMTTTAKVSLHWDGESTHYQTPTISPAVPDKGLFFNIPKSEVAKVLGKTATLTAHVQNGCSPPVTSPPQRYEIVNDLALPAPITSDAINGQINLDQLHEDSGVFVEYTFPGMTTTAKVSLHWDGESTHYQTPTISPAVPDKGLFFNIPKSEVAKVLGKTATLTAHVQIGGSPPVTSPPQRYEIVKGLTLPAPILDQASAGQIDLGSLGTNATVTYNYPGKANGHLISLRWAGSSIYNTPIEIVKLTEPLTFTIPKNEIAKDLGRTATLTANVSVNDDPVVTSQALTLSVTQNINPNPGATTANELNARYRETTNTCTGNKPAYYCNGIIIRSVDDGSFDPWNPSPSAEQLGAISFSYLRIDSHVSDLYRRAGFIFLPQEKAIAQNKAPRYLCIYAYDAGTIVGTRPSKGCGLKPRAQTTADLSTCASKNATTVQGWYDYTKSITNRDYQCSLSTENAAQFAVSYQVRANRPPNMQALWNELMVDLWPQNHGANLPIEAFFFRSSDNTSLTHAKNFQTKYKARTGLWKPVVALDFAKLNDTPFSYNNADQAVQP